MTYDEGNRACLASAVGMFLIFTYSDGNDLCVVFFYLAMADRGSAGGRGGFGRGRGRGGRRGRGRGRGGRGKPEDKEVS